ncbi:MAG: hypothetical protein SFY32_01350 [Bacteroidota bacterium]|nr:hypothetical protein [Bacteroidota bacterium]
MFKTTHLRIFILFSSLIFCFNYCVPPEEVLSNDDSKFIIEDAYDNIATDSLLFDTIFTDYTSITKRVKVKNPTGNARMITSISVGGGSSSPFELNINGQKTQSFSKIFLRGKDSLSVFVKVNLSKSNQPTPFLSKDSILIQPENGAIQKVYLTAWGRDAIYYSGETLSGTNIWDNTNARFIYKTITIPSGSSLTITKGVQIRAATNAAIIVYGTIKIQGDTGINQKVIFSGSRSDGYWKATPGMWKGIMLMPGAVQNEITNAEIYNTTDAISIGSSTENKQSTELKLSNTIIMYASGNGIIAHNPTIKMWNCVVSNCAGFYFGAYNGGDFTLVHNTFAENLSNNITRQKPCVRITPTDLEGVGANPTKVYFVNNIAWGERFKEAYFVNSGEYTLFEVKNNVMRDSTQLADNKVFVFKRDDFNNNPRNYKKLLDTLHLDYKLRPLENSIVRNSGLKLNEYQYDILGSFRGDTTDVGAYQYKK